MLRRYCKGFIIAIAAILLLGSQVMAQPATAGMTRGMDGRIVLHNGDVIAGSIKAVGFGVGTSSGFSPDRRPGVLKITADGKIHEISAKQTRRIDVTWESREPSAIAPAWFIKQIAVTKKDGSKVVGEPTWKLHISQAIVEQDDGEVKKISEYPIDEAFNPEQLIETVIFGEPQAEEQKEAKKAPQKEAKKPQAEQKPPEEEKPEEEKEAKEAEEKPAPEPAEKAAAEAEKEKATKPERQQPAEKAKAAKEAAPQAQQEAPEAEKPKIEPTPVSCTFAFVNLSSTDRQRVEKIIKSYATDQSIEVSGAEKEGVLISFTLPDITRMPQLAQEIRYKEGDDGEMKLLFEEAGRELATEFRTAKITGEVTISVSFQIAPEAKLYYSPAPGDEMPIPADRIDDRGRVTLDVSLSPGQQYVYARTVLGEVERCIKIDIYSGAKTEISPSAYAAHE